MARNAQYTKLSYKFQFVKTINTEVIQVNVSLNLLLGIVTFFHNFRRVFCCRTCVDCNFLYLVFFFCVSFAFVCFNKYRTVVYGCCCCLLSAALIACAAFNWMRCRPDTHRLTLVVRMCVCVTGPRNHITRVFACVCVCVGSTRLGAKCGHFESLLRSINCRLPCTSMGKREEKREGMGEGLSRKLTWERQMLIQMQRIVNKIEHVNLPCQS